MKGALSDGVLPGVLRDLYVGRRTGMLYFLRGEDRRGVRFQAGHMVRADTNVREERFGETLVRLGWLAQADMDRATELVARDKKRLGLVLQELGIMDKDRLEEAIALHVKEILLKVFSLPDGEYAFEDQSADAPVNEDLTVRLSTGEMILEAVRRVGGTEDIVRHSLGDMDRILGLSTDPLLRFQRVTLSPADGYVLSRIDGTLCAREIVQMSPMPAPEVERSLFGLLCTGIVEYLPLPPKAAPRPAPRRARAEAPVAPPPTVVVLPPFVPPPRPPEPPKPPPVSEESLARRKEILEAFEGMKGKNHFEILGIPRASNETQVKEAYFRLAKRFHPDGHHDPALADLKDKMEAVFIRLGAAYEVLRNTRSRGSYEADLASRTPRVPSPTGGPAESSTPADPQKEARAAEEAIRRAQKKFDDEQFWDAIQILEPSVAKALGKPRSRGQILLARCYLKNPNWVKRGEELLLEVIKEDKKNADAYYLLANIYKVSGLKSRARTMFEKFLDLRPDSQEAAAELAALVPEETDEPEEGGGLLKKLFRKS